MFSKLTGIDLGTANTLIYVRGRGIVLDEPSVVSVDAETKKLLAVGQRAKQMLGRTPGKIVTLRPLKDGVIADFEGTEIMLGYFVKKLRLRGLLRKPTILICCPSNITPVERNAISDAALRCGAKKVYIEEEPKVAAIGAGLDISKPSGCMIVDIGGGTTDIAVLSLGDIVTSTQLKIAGDRFDKDIINYVKDSYRLLIGEPTAEEIKIKVGTALKDVRSEQLDISGRDLVNGLPQTWTITSEEVAQALSDSIHEIVCACRHVLESTPPQLSSDLMKTGIVLTGGGSLLAGLDQLLQQELKVPVRVAENALSCVAKGTGIMLENLKAAG